MAWLRNNIKEVNEKIRDKINKVLELPIEVAKDSLRVITIDKEYILLEGKSKVANYFDNYIKIKTEKYTVIIEGENLTIREISDVDLIINGNIQNISYA